MAEQTYAAAVEEIARVKAAGDTIVRLFTEGFRSLNRIPTEIADLKNLKKIYLNRTKITDLEPLSSLTNLQSLELENTPVDDLTPLAGLTNIRMLDLVNTNVSDLTPLAGLAKLRRLALNNTPVSDLAPLGGLTNLVFLNLDDTNAIDLRPLAGLGQLGQPGAFQPDAFQANAFQVGRSSLRFRNTPATARDGRLAELSEIEDDQERTHKTLEYLRSLPRWPEPYTPEYTPDGSPPQPIGSAPEAPEADAQPRLVLTDDDRIDIAPILPGDAELDDPIRRRLYERLPRAVDDLLKAVNRYPEIDRPVRSLKRMSEAAFEDADFLMIHLDINELTDLRQSQSSRPDDEKLDPDCLAALDAVLRIGPGITMGHPDIEALEARGREYERSRVGEGVAEHERKIVGALGDSALATERTQHVARMTASAGTTGRVAQTRSGFTRNTILLMAYIAGKSIDAAAGNVLGGPTVAAAEFLIAQREAILATAPTWGQSALVWAEYVLIRARQIIDEARQGD